MRGDDRLKWRRRSSGGEETVGERGDEGGCYRGRSVQGLSNWNTPSLVCLSFAKHEAINCCLHVHPIQHGSNPEPGFSGSRSDPRGSPTYRYVEMMLPWDEARRQLLTTYVG